jgi:hypothetical protein
MKARVWVSLNPVRARVVDRQRQQILEPGERIIHRRAPPQARTKKTCAIMDNSAGTNRNDCVKAATRRAGRRLGLRPAHVAATVADLRGWQQAPRRGRRRRQPHPDLGDEGTNLGEMCAPPSGRQVGPRAIGRRDTAFPQTPAASGEGQLGERLAFPLSEERTPRRGVATRNRR